MVHVHSNKVFSINSLKRQIKTSKPLVIRNDGSQEILKSGERATKNLNNAR